MKGETPMTLQDLALTMGLFLVAVLIVLALSTIAFIKWDQREKRRRARQIERARTEPEFDERHKPPGKASPER